MVYNTTNAAVQQYLFSAVRAYVMEITDLVRGRAVRNSDILIYCKRIDVVALFLLLLQLLSSLVYSRSGNHFAQVICANISYCYFSPAVCPW